MNQSFTKRELMRRVNGGEIVGVDERMDGGAIEELLD